jgi:hypothetical protein
MQIEIANRAITFNYVKDSGFHWKGIVNKLMASFFSKSFDYFELKVPIEVINKKNGLTELKVHLDKVVNGDFYYKLENGLIYCYGTADSFKVKISSIHQILSSIQSENQIKQQKSEKI